MRKLRTSSEHLILTMSIDHRLVFWRLHPDEQGSVELVRSWRLSCLSQKVTQITLSETEKELIIMNSKDRVIRSWDYTKHDDALYINEFSKGLDNIDIQHIEMHPTEEGICAFLAEGSK